jgi:putative peptidoglycan lipid II flippase
MMLMLNIPATMGLLVLASPIVALIFEHGRFTSGDTAATAAALAFYAPGLVGYSAVKLISPAFYAMGNSRIPVMASGVSVLLYVVLSLLLVQILGHRGLALGTAVAALVNAGILLWLLRSRLGGIDDRRLSIATLKIAIAALLMAVVAHQAERFLYVPFAGNSVFAQAIRVFGAIAAGMAVLGISAHLLKIEEFSRLRRRFIV